jgi:hypothetical protein
VRQLALATHASVLTLSLEAALLAEDQTLIAAGGLLRGLLPAVSLSTLLLHLCADIDVTLKATVSKLLLGKVPHFKSINLC